MALRGLGALEIRLMPAAARRAPVLPPAPRARARPAATRAAYTNQSCTRPRPRRPPGLSPPHAASDTRLLAQPSQASRSRAACRRLVGVARRAPRPPGRRQLRRLDLRARRRRLEAPEGAC
jgi:hypothetical protein